MSEDLNKKQDEQGEWLPRFPNVDNWVYECSKCGEYEFARPWKWGYCPDCGKPMKRVELDEE